MFEHFSADGRKAVARAHEEVVARRHTTVGVTHLLLALLHTECHGGQVLASLGCAIDHSEPRSRRALLRGETKRGVGHRSPRARRRP